MTLKKVRFRLNYTIYVPVTEDDYSPGATLDSMIEAEKDSFDSSIMEYLERGEGIKDCEITLLDEKSIPMKQIDWKERS